MKSYEILQSELHVNHLIPVRNHLEHLRVEVLTMAPFCQVSGADAVDVAVADFAGQANGKKGNALAPSNPDLSLKRILDIFGPFL